MKPVIYGSTSVCIEISFVSSDCGEANKRTRKYREDPKNREKQTLRGTLRRSVFLLLKRLVFFVLHAISALYRSKIDCAVCRYLHVYIVPF